MRFADRQHLWLVDVGSDAHEKLEVGLTFSPDTYTDAEALAAIARVMAINRPRTITKVVVETARESLVIGP